jgi:hypothetical protein
MYIADMDIASKLPTSDLVDELFSNMTNFIIPNAPSEQPFMPALESKYVNCMTPERQNVNIS